MIELFFLGGLSFMLPLLAASILVVTIAIERFRRYRKEELDYQTFSDSMQITLRERGISAGKILAEESAGPTARLWDAALRMVRLPVEVVQEKLQVLASDEIDRLQKYLPELMLIAQLAPLIGILGTVWGMIEAFQVMESGLNQGAGIGSNLLVGGIWKALITTAGGLLVALPSIVLHHLLQQRVERFTADLDRTITDIVVLLTPQRSSPPTSSLSTGDGGTPASRITPELTEPHRR